MIVKLLTDSKLKRRLQRLVGVYTCQNSNCWKSHATAHFIFSKCVRIKMAYASNGHIDSDQPLHLPAQSDLNLGFSPMGITLR